MQHFTHQSHIDKLPASPLRLHIQARFDQLSEDTDVPPNLVLGEEGDDITGPDYAFVGSRGLLSDLFEEQAPGHPEFARPYEWASYLPDLYLYEALLLTNNEDGFWIMIPESIVEAHPDLKWILTDEHQGGLADPQPLQ
jgi:hypothetical protein